MGGPLDTSRLTPKQLERFWGQVGKGHPSGCWVWAGRQTVKGYGTISFFSSPYRAHRVAYELLVGPIPDGLVIDHLCRNRLCVNPDHLEPVTIKENVMRGVGLTARLASATHCVNGHEFTPENTGINAGHRFCRECNRANSRARRAKDRAAGKKPKPLTPEQRERKNARRREAWQRRTA
jgi:hypothetical protein